MTDTNTTTELEAINVMLDGIGSSPVSSLTIAADLDVARAVKLLSEVTREVQSQGWDFNTDKKWPLPLTPEGWYVVPDNVLSIKVNKQDFPSLKVTFRGGKLWDQTNLTFVWTQALTFDLTWLFPFTDLPETARHYITMCAARKFQARVLGSSSLGKFSNDDELEARAIFIDAESLEADHNILTGSYAVRRVLYRTSW